MTLSRLLGLGHSTARPQCYWLCANCNIQWMAKKKKQKKTEPSSEDIETTHKWFQYPSTQFLKLRSSLCPINALSSTRSAHDVSVLVFLSIWRSSCLSKMRSKQKMSIWIFIITSCILLIGQCSVSPSLSDQ